MVIKGKKKQRAKAIYSAKLTSKHQATVPKEIRKLLDLESGDEILYELQPDNTVRVRKTSPLDLEYLRALNSTMNEWTSDDDDRAYRDL